MNAVTIEQTTPKFIGPDGSSAEPAAPPAKVRKTRTAAPRRAKRSSDEIGSAAELKATRPKAKASRRQAEEVAGTVQEPTAPGVNPDGRLQIIPTAYLDIDADADRVEVEQHGFSADFDRLVENIQQLGIL